LAQQSSGLKPSRLGGRDLRTHQDLEQVFKIVELIGRVTLT